MSAKLFESLNTFIPVNRLGTPTWNALLGVTGYLDHYHGILFKDIRVVALYQDNDPYGRKAFFFYLPNVGSLVLFERYGKKEGDFHIHLNEGQPQLYNFMATGLLRDLMESDCGSITAAREPIVQRLLQTFSTLSGKTQQQLSKAGFAITRIKKMLQELTEETPQEPIAKSIMGQRPTHSERETQSIVEESVKEDNVKKRQALIMVDPNDGKEFTQINGEIFWEDLVAHPVFAELEIAKGNGREILYLPLKEEHFQGQGKGSTLEYFVKFVIQELGFPGWGYDIIQGDSDFDIKVHFTDAGDGYREEEVKSFSLLSILEVSVVHRVRDEPYQRTIRGCDFMGISNRRGIFFDTDSSDLYHKLELSDVERFFTVRAGYTPE